jgi:PAS domain S-box-containing protein
MAGLFAVEPRDLNGCICHELMHASQGFVDACPFLRMLETGVRETLDLRLDGRWYQVSADPLRDERGAVVGAVHVLRDITLSKRTEQALREERRRLIEVNALSVELSASRASDDVGEVVARRLRQATDAVGASFGLYDPVSRTIGPMRLDLSPGVRRSLPRPLYRRLESMRTPVDDALYATMTTEVVGRPRSLSEATGGLLPVALSSLLERAAGVDRFIGLAFTAEGELYGSSLVVLRRGTSDPPRELLEALAHMTGVALRRRRAEQELDASQALARFWANVAENAAEAISVGYPDGRLGECNQAYCDLIGYDREEVRSTDWAAELTPPEWLDSERAHLAELERTGRPVRYEKEYIRKDGSRVPIELLVHLVAHPGEEPYYIGFVTDISERKCAEAKIRRLNRDLERRVRERTDELTAANRELQEFVYSVSHDLRTPLRAVDGFSLTVMEDYGEAIGEQGRNDLRRVRAAAQKMGELIDALLALSRLGHREIAVERVDLSAVARRLGEALRSADPTRDVELRVQDGLSAEADPALLDVVLDNLLGNAWKFSSCRECAHIEVGVETRGGERAFFVRDDGAGFDPRYVDKLFQPFQRLHGADDFPGTGIGLATVARVLGRMGGRWWAEGEPDHGATFYFTLPGA